MFELVGLGIFVALLWIGWELHRVCGRMGEFLSAFGESYAEIARADRERGLRGN